MPLYRFAALAAALLLGLPPVAYGGTLKSKEDARTLADSVMQLVVADKIDEAFKKLKPSWPLGESELDTLVLKTIAMRNTVGDRFGRPLGFAFVREEAVGDYLVRFTYAEKREHHPLRWIFTFYRATDEWMVDGTSWDDNAGALFSK